MQPQSVPIIPSTTHLSPDIAKIDYVSHAQDISHLQGIDDTIFPGFPDNPNFTSHSDGEVVEQREVAKNDSDDERDFFSLVDAQITELILQGENQQPADTNADLPNTPKESSRLSNFQLPPRLLHRPYMMQDVASPPVTRSRAVLSNSFDILSLQ